MTTDVITPEERELQAEMTTALRRWLQLQPEPPSIAEAWEEAWRLAAEGEYERGKSDGYTEGWDDRGEDFASLDSKKHLPIPIPPGVPR
jgi:hypothetical protein